jgi:hypothetical protein
MLHCIICGTNLGFIQPIGADMSYIITYNSEIQILEIKFQGKVTKNDLKKAYEEAFPIAVREECFLFLNDFIEAIISLRVFDVVEWAKTILKIGEDYGQNARLLKRAIILPVSYKDSKFAETVASNRGYRIKLFKDVDNAKKWLLDEK